MSKDKVKSGIGGGTGKKGWTRWQAAVKKAGTKPYVSKGTKKPGSTNTAASDNKGGTSEK
jgi:hypothetical protein